MADITSTIGTGKTYTTVNSWVADVYNSATGADNAIGHLYDEVYAENASINDTTPATILLEPDTGEGHNGTEGTGARIIPTTGTPLAFSVDSITINGIEFSQGGSASGNHGVYQTDSAATGCTIRRCIIHDIDANQFYQAVSGIYQPYFGTAYLSVLNNLIYNIAQPAASPTEPARGIYQVNVTSDSANATLHNTVWNITAGGAGATEVCISAEGDVRNNIACDADDEDYDSAATPNTEDYNLASDNTDAGANSIGADDGVVTSAQFVSTSPVDLHLKSGADAIDAGLDLGTTPTGVAIDIDNVDYSAGTRDDMGAHEFVAGGTPYTKDLSESFSLTDTPKKASSRALAESVTLSDNLAKLLIRILTETITTSDALDLVVLFVKALTENITLADAAIKLTGKPLSEGVTLTDGKSHDVTRALIESLSLNSLITKLTGKTATESISLSDALATALTFVKLLTEGLSLTDNQQRSVNRALIESLTLTGGLTRESFKTFVESLGLSDTFASEAVAIVVAFVAEILLSNYYNIQIDLSPFYSVDIESEPLYSLEPEID